MLLLASSSRSCSTLLKLLLGLQALTLINGVGELAEGDAYDDLWSYVVPWALFAQGTTRRASVDRDRLEPLEGHEDTNSARASRVRT